VRALWPALILLAACGGGGSGPLLVQAMEGLHVSGGALLNAQGERVQLRGVNRSGTEYACAQGLGLTDGPVDAAAMRAIAGWGANAVRVPMNESCWLSLNGVEPRYAGAAYQDAIAEEVRAIGAAGMLAILELHWSTPDDRPALGQEPMPDRAHAVRFWSEVAQRFSDEPRVAFDPFNEPFPDDNRDTDEAWRCWRLGGTCAGVPFEAAGMQELVDAIRSSGAMQPILLGGVQYANALTQWNRRAPLDPAHNLVAAWHVYNFTGCNDEACFDSVIRPLDALTPVVATEVGEDDRFAAFSENVMHWLDGQRIGYLAWSWDVWPSPFSLVRDYDGTPNGIHGVTVRAHLLARGSGE
jgi:endoglucanase